MAATPAGDEQRGHDCEETFLLMEFDQDQPMPSAPSLTPGSDCRFLVGPPPTNDNIVLLGKQLFPFIVNRSFGTYLFFEETSASQKLCYVGKSDVYLTLGSNVVLLPKDKATRFDSRSVEGDG